ncbi:MAG: hypothetical protein JWR35_1617 [Marmoricola sp.]|nr:hypothetical protein [Marmoricola sp.]
MLVAAFILLLLAVLLLLAGIFGGHGDAKLDLGVFNIDADSSVVFFLGMITLLLFVIGLLTLRLGMRRARAHRRDRKKVGELSQKLTDFQRDKQPEEETHEDR